MTPVDLQGRALAILTEELEKLDNPGNPFERGLVEITADWLDAPPPPKDDAALFRSAVRSWLSSLEGIAAQFIKQSNDDGSAYTWVVKPWLVSVVGWSAATEHGRAADSEGYSLMQERWSRAWDDAYKKKLERRAVDAKQVEYVPIGHDQRTARSDPNTSAVNVMVCSRCQKGLYVSEGSLFWHGDHLGVEWVAVGHNRCFTPVEYRYSVPLYAFADPLKSLRHAASMAADYRFTGHQMQKVVDVAWAASVCATEDQVKRHRESPVF